jgi:hypothetical protein
MKSLEICHLSKTYFDVYEGAHHTALEDVSLAGLAASTATLSKTQSCRNADRAGARRSEADSEAPLEHS